MLMIKSPSNLQHNHIYFTSGTCSWLKEKELFSFFRWWKWVIENERGGRADCQDRGQALTQSKFSQMNPLLSHPFPACWNTQILLVLLWKIQRMVSFLFEKFCFASSQALGEDSMVRNFLIIFMNWAWQGQHAVPFCWQWGRGTMCHSEAGLRFSPCHLPVGSALH